MKKNYKQFATLMKAISDETRIKILDMLSDGELCACNILEEFDITQPTLSYHMKILSESGLIYSRKDGVWTRYSINKDAIRSLKVFFDDIDAKIMGVDMLFNNFRR